MHIEFWTYLSRVLNRPRRRCKFIGFVIGGVMIGIIVPSKQADDEIPGQPLLPGIDEVK